MTVIYRIILLGCLLLSVLSAARRPRYRMHWDSFECNCHWALFSNVSCRIGPEDMEKISASIQVLESVTQIWCRYKVLVPRPTQNTEMVLFESTFDACQFLREGVLSNKLALFVYQNMIRDSNLAKQCPVNQGPLYFHNISVLGGFPAFLPETHFTVIIVFFKPNSTDSVDVTIKGSVMEYNRARKNIWH